MAPVKRSNSMLYLGIASIVVFAIFLFVFLSALSPDTEKALVPKAPIAPFQPVTLDRFDLKDVPANEVLAGLVTQAYYDEMTEANKKLYTVTSLPAGEVFYQSAVSDDANSGCAILSKDERIVAVTTTLSGGVAGALEAGSIVDVSSPGSDVGGTADYAKILAVGSANGISGDVCGAPARAPKGDSSDSNQKVVIALAVAQDQAQGIAGQEVVMVRNPFCKIIVDSKLGGVIVPVSAGDASGCTPPTSRLAGQQPTSVLDDNSGDAPPVDPGVTDDTLEPGTTDETVDPGVTDETTTGPRP